MVEIRSTRADAETVGRVRQVPVPPDARALTRLSSIGYEDAFLVGTGRDHARTPEQWARAILEDAPAPQRSALVSGWSGLGLKIGSARTPQRVLGWEIRDSTDQFVLLGADSRIGMPAELLFVPQSDSLLFATFVQQDNHAVRLIWAGVERVHVRTVRRLLEQASRRCSI